MIFFDGIKFYYVLIGEVLGGRVVIWVFIEVFG